MCPPPSAGSVEPPTKSPKRGGLEKSSTFVGGLLGKRGDFFRGGGGGCNFHMKNKLKSEIFNDKKVYQQKYFSVINKNSNCEILTKNLVTFKR